MKKNTLKIKYIIHLSYRSLAIKWSVDIIIRIEEGADK